MKHRWFVLLAAIFVSTFEFGVLFSLSALYLPILETFNTDRATAALVQSVSLGVTMSIGIITGLLVKIFGCRKVSFVGAILTPLGYIVSYFAETVVFLIISLGVVSGFGISFMYVSSTVIVAEYFTEPGKSLALATVQTGVGIAGVFYPYLLTFLLEIYGLQSTFLITGGLFLNSFAACVLYSKPTYQAVNETISNYPIEIEDKSVHESLSKHMFDDEKTPLLRAEHENISPKQGKASPTNKDFASSKKDNLFDDGEAPYYNRKGQCVYRQNKNKTDRESSYSSKMSETFRNAIRCCKELVQDKSYMLFLLGDSLVVAFANGFVAVLVDIFTTEGYSEEEGLSAFLPYFLTSIFGRILPGILQQSKRISPFVLPVLCAIFGVLGQLCVLLSSDYAIMMLGCCLAGLSVGGAISASSVVAIRLVAKEAFPVAFGLVVSLSGILTAAVAPLNGFIRDTTGSYSIVLLVTAVVQFVGGILLFLVLIIKRIQKRNHNLSVLEKR